MGKIKKKVILVGASGQGKVCAEIAKLSGKYSEILFLDDDLQIKKCGEYPVCGTSKDVDRYLGDDTDFFVSIGNYTHRRRIQEQIESLSGNVVTLIHPSAVVSGDASIGIGTVVMPGAVVNSDAKIGKGVILNTSCSVDHDCDIQDYVHIAVGAHVCGTVNIGKNTWVGAGAIISNNINICEDCFIGAGAVVVNDIKESGTYIGVPAKQKGKK